VSKLSVEVEGVEVEDVEVCKRKRIEVNLSATRPRR
jgi:hypothetical protein